MGVYKKRKYLDRYADGGLIKAMKNRARILEEAEQKAITPSPPPLPPREPVQLPVPPNPDPLRRPIGPVNQMAASQAMKVKHDADMATQSLGLRRFADGGSVPSPYLDFQAQQAADSQRRKVMEDQLADTNRIRRPRLNPSVLANAGLGIARTLGRAAGGPSPLGVAMGSVFHSGDAGAASSPVTDYLSADSSRQQLTTEYPDQVSRAEVRGPTPEPMPRGMVSGRIRGLRGYANGGFIGLPGYGAEGYQSIEGRTMGPRDSSIPISSNPVSNKPWVGRPRMERLGSTRDLMGVADYGGAVRNGPSDFTQLSPNAPANASYSTATRGTALSATPPVAPTPVAESAPIIQQKPIGASGALTDNEWNASIDRMNLSGKKAGGYPMMADGGKVPMTAWGGPTEDNESTRVHSPIYKGPGGIWDGMPMFADGGSVPADVDAVRLARPSKIKGDATTALLAEGGAKASEYLVRKGLPRFAEIAASGGQKIVPGMFRFVPGAAGVMGSARSLLQGPEERAHFAQNVGLNQTPLGNIGADAWRTMANVGNATTGGLADVVGRYGSTLYDKARRGMPAGPMPQYGFADGGAVPHGRVTKDYFEEVDQQMSNGGGVEEGMIYGEGGPTDDKQPIMASPGEFVVPKDVARKNIKKLRKMVAEEHTPVHKQGLRNGFMSGGLVDQFGNPVRYADDVAGPAQNVADKLLNRGRGFWEHGVKQARDAASQIRGMDRAGLRRKAGETLGRGSRYARRALEQAAPQVRSAAQTAQEAVQPAVQAVQEALPQARRGLRGAWDWAKSLVGRGAQAAQPAVDAVQGAAQGARQAAQPAIEAAQQAAQRVRTTLTPLSSEGKVAEAAARARAAGAAKTAAQITTEQAAASRLGEATAENAARTAATKATADAAAKKAAQGLIGRSFGSLKNLAKGAVSAPALTLAVGVEAARHSKELGEPEDQTHRDFEKERSRSGFRISDSADELSGGEKSKLLTEINSGDPVRAARARERLLGSVPQAWDPEYKPKGPYKSAMTDEQAKAYTEQAVKDAQTGKYEDQVSRGLRQAGIVSPSSPKVDKLPEAGTDATDLVAPEGGGFISGMDSQTGKMRLGSYTKDTMPKPMGITDTSTPEQKAADLARREGWKKESADIDARMAARDEAEGRRLDEMRERNQQNVGAYDRREGLRGGNAQQYMSGISDEEQAAQSMQRRSLRDATREQNTAAMARAQLLANAQKYGVDTQAATSRYGTDVGMLKSIMDDARLQGQATLAQRKENMTETDKYVADKLTVIDPVTKKPDPLATQARQQQYDQFVRSPMINNPKFLAQFKKLDGSPVTSVNDIPREQIEPLLQRFFTASSQVSDLPVDSGDTRLEGLPADFGLRKMKIGDWFNWGSDRDRNAINLAEAMWGASGRWNPFVSPEAQRVLTTGTQGSQAHNTALNASKYDTPTKRMQLIRDFESRGKHREADDLRSIWFPRGR